MDSGSIGAARCFRLWTSRVLGLYGVRVPIHCPLTALVSVRVGGNLMYSFRALGLNASGDLGFGGFRAPVHRPLTAPVAAQVGGNLTDGRNQSMFLAAALPRAAFDAQLAHLVSSVLYSDRRAVQAIGRIDRGADQNEGLNGTLLVRDRERELRPFQV